MPSYRVINKFIYMTETQDVQMGTRMDGSPNIVRQPKYPMRKVEVGEIVDDPDPQVLATAPDRFELVEGEALQQAREHDPSLAVYAPLRGVHEPASDIDAVVQKPPLTGAEVAGKLQAQAEVGKVAAEQEKQKAEMDKSLQDARAKAFEQATQHAVQRQRAQASRGEAAPPEGALPVSTHQGSTPPGGTHPPAADPGHESSRRRTP